MSSDLKVMLDLALRSVFGTLILFPRRRFILLDMEVPSEYEQLKRLFLSWEGAQELLVKQIQDLGFDPFLFLDNAITEDGLEELVELYKDRYARYKLVEELQGLLKQTQEDTIEQIKRKTQDILHRFDSSVVNQQTMEEALTEFLKEITQLKETGGLKLPLVDDIVPTLLGGELVVVAARPSVGKTAFLLSLAEEWASKGVPVGIVSVEMPESALIARMLAKFVPDDSKKASLYQGFLDMSNEEFRNVYKKAFSQLSELPIYFAKLKNNSLGHIEANMRELINLFDVKVILVDYLQLIHAPGGSRVEEVSRISNGFKFFAKSTNVTVVLASQLNRESEKRENKRPTMAELRESGAIEQDADIILLMWRPNRDRPIDEIDPHNYETWREYTEVIVAKQRNGTVGNLYLWFDMKNQRFIKYQDWIKKGGI